MDTCSTGAGQGLGRTLGGHAIRHAVERTGLSMDDIGLRELKEAFAV